MTINLTDKELYTILYAILCDGLYYFPSYGFRLDYNQDEYSISRGNLPPFPLPCIEDVQLQMLKDGYGLTFTDVEGEGDNTVTLNAALINKNYQSIPAKTIITMLEGDYDAEVADECLQYLLYGKLIFG